MYIVPIEQVMRPADLEVLLQFRQELPVFLRDDACKDLFNHFGRAVGKVTEGLERELSSEPVYFGPWKEKTAPSGKRYVRNYLKTPDAMFRVRFRPAGDERPDEGAEMVVLDMVYPDKADAAIESGQPWGAFQFSRIFIKNKHQLRALLEQPEVSNPPQPRLTHSG
jgi:hypothetical protein